MKGLVKFWNVVMMQVSNARESNSIQLHCPWKWIGVVFKRVKCLKVSSRDKRCANDSSCKSSRLQ